MFFSLNFNVSNIRDINMELGISRICSFKDLSPKNHLSDTRGTLKQSISNKKIIDHAT